MEYNAAVGEEALKIDSVTGAIVGGTDAIAKNTDALIENAKGRLKSRLMRTHIKR